MKKRLLVLMLAFLLMFSVAAPALAAEGDPVDETAETVTEEETPEALDTPDWNSPLLQKFTSEELQLLVELGVLNVLYAGNGGALLEGVYFDIYGNSSDEYTLPANTFVYVDESGTCYLMRVVQDADGNFVWQVYAMGAINSAYMSMSFVAVTVGQWVTGVMGEDGEPIGWG